MIEIYAHCFKCKAKTPLNIISIESMKHGKSKYVTGTCTVCNTKCSKTIKKDETQAVQEYLSSKQ
jgi:hypothetical protein